MTKAKPLPPVEVLREYFSYDSNTGLVSWLKNSGPRGNAQAGYVDNRTGYIRVGFQKSTYQMHRLIWKLVTGSEPPINIDHANQIRTDNRWKNLRIADNSQSRANRSYPRGKYLHGVKPCSTGKWRTNAKINQGSFTTEQEAHDAYVRWHREHYGEFSVYAAPSSSQLPVPG